MLITGGLIGLFLIADALGLAGSHAVFNDLMFRNIYKLVSGLAAVTAIGIAAWGLKKSFGQPVEGERAGKSSFLILALFLLLGAAAVTVRQGVLVRATGRAPEDHFPIGVILASILAGIILFWPARGKIRLAGLGFAFGASILMLLAFILGLQVDFLAVTQARAARLGQAIERYHQEQGTYPAGLGELTPGYLSIPLGPLTGRGQVWCYQSGPNGFRLGYAFLQRYYDWGDGVTPFYEPYFAIKTPIVVGEPPQGWWMCDTELEQLKIHYGL